MTCWLIIITITTSKLCISHAFDINQRSDDVQVRQLKQKHIDEWAEHVSTEVGGAYLNIKVAGRYGDR